MTIHSIYNPVLLLHPPFIPIRRVRGRVQNSSLADWRITKRQVNSNSDNNEKTQTSNTGTEKQQRGVQINISRAGTQYTDGDIGGGWCLRYNCCGWMETIKQHSEGGAAVTQQWCRYVTKPKHTTRRVCVCVHMI